MTVFRTSLAGLLALLVASATTSLDAAPPTAEQALRLSPVQKGVEYDRPDATEAKECTIKSEKIGDVTGWVVRNDNGTTLRRFLDSNDDNVVDTWCYFLGGLEIYRDIDVDFNGKADQFRWLNTAGSRWALDKNEDGKIDTWKQISAEEVTAELVTALANRESVRFQSLLLSPSELKGLRLGSTKQRQIAEKLDATLKQFGSLAASQKTISRQTRWLDFSAMRPGLVPAGTDGSTKDLTVYENVAAMVETSGKQHLIYVGTMIDTDAGWRLLDAPDLNTSTQAGVARDGFFYQASLNRGGDAAAAIGVQPSQESQKLFTQLEKLDAEAATAVAPAALARVNAKRADVLKKLIEKANSTEERATWTRQFADTISGAVQTGGFPKGVKMLAEMTKKLSKDARNRDLTAYTKYRFMLASYTYDMQAPKADYAKIQDKWLEDLEQFVDDFPKSNDTAEAMLQLATAQEFSGEEDAAKKWYDRILKDFAKADVAKKAAGAKRRLDCVGRSIPLAGKTLRGASIDLARFRGKTVVVQYWATWCEPCKEDHKTLKTLVAKYGKRGFSVVGVNLDSDVKAITSYMKESKLPWHNLYAQGGLESRFAHEMGIMTLPAMFLIDKSGRVVNRSIHAGELETELKKRLARAPAPKK